MSASPERIGYLFRDYAVRTILVGIGCLNEYLLLGILQEMFQTFHTASLGSFQINVRCLQRRIYNHFSSSTTYCYIQSFFSPIVVQGTEVHRHLAVFIWTIADREQDDIAFVTLYVFEVLYKDRLVQLVGRLS